MRIWPFRHIGLKLLSVALALLLWMVVAGEETVERVLRVPLELQQFPTSLELVGDFTDSGRRPRARLVRHAEPRGQWRHRGGARPAGREAGPRLFRLTPEEVRAPFGVEVVQVSPTTVAMTFVNPALRHVSKARGDGPPVERTVRDRPLELRNLPANLTASATPGQVDVTLTGPSEALVRIEPNTVTAYVDLAGLGAGQYTLTVRADVGRDAGVMRTRHRLFRCGSPMSDSRRDSDGVGAVEVPRLFGTDGVRGTAGQYPLDRSTVRRLGAALVRALPQRLALRIC